MPPDPSTPRPLSEDQLCDWIDGDLSAHDVARLMATSGRSDLAQRVAQMQEQRALLATLEPVRAPRDIHDRVMAALEREMLLGAGEAERASQVEASAPQLTLVGEGPLPLDARRAKRSLAWLPRMAMAAGFVLVAGGVTFLVAKSISLSRAPLVTPVPVPPVPNVALHEGKDHTQRGKRDEAQPGQDSGATQSAEAQDRSLAAGQASGATLRASEDREASIAMGTFASGAGQAAGQVVGQMAEPAPVSLERAAVLASEGRLAIRVLSETTSGLSALEQAGGTPINSAQRPWRVSRNIPAQVVAGVLPSVLPSALAGAGAGSSVFNDPRAMAAELVTPLVGLQGVVAQPMGGAGAGGAKGADGTGWSRVRASYAVSVPATEAGLDVLRSSLRTRLKGVVEFFELPEPVQAMGGGSGGSGGGGGELEAARDVLWWTQTSTQWTARAIVPMVVASPK